MLADIILGPCPCQRCGEPVWWARSKRYGSPPAWRDANGHRHFCEAGLRG